MDVAGPLTITWSLQSAQQFKQLNEFILTRIPQKEILGQCRFQSTSNTGQINVTNISAY